MQMFFPKELETRVDAEGDGYIYIRQDNEDQTESVVKLTIHQFQEIWNREKKLIEGAWGNV